MTGYSCIFSIRPPPAALEGEADAVTMRRVDLRIGFAEVASGCYPAYQPELARRPGHSSASVVRVHIRRHPARDEPDASRDPRHRVARWRIVIRSSQPVRALSPGGTPRPG